MKNAQVFWRSISFPLIWIVLVIFIFASWDFVGLPPQEVLLPLIEQYFETYGLPVVFAAAFLESMLVVGWYFPGGVVIFLSVAVSPTPLKAASVVAAVIAGLYVGYLLNFFVGKYGWYRLLLRFGIRRQIEEAQTKLLRHGVKAIFSSYWMPGLGSIVATAAGILQYQVADFLKWSLISTVVWSAFWGTVVYVLGERALTLLLNPVLIIAIIALWGAGRLVMEYRARGTAPAQEVSAAKESDPSR